jgi:flagellar hook-associated protein 2
VSNVSSPTFNFGGIASGLDTNTIVSQLLAIEGRSKTRLGQQQAVERARQTTLNDIQTRLRNLSNSVAGLSSAGTWGDQQEVSSADATKVAVRRTAGAAAGGYSVRVDALARAAQMTQGSSMTTAAVDDTLRIAVGSTTVDVAVTAGDSLATIADRINGTSDVPVYASVINNKLILSGKATGAANAITVSDGNAGNAGTLAADLGFTQTQAGQNADFWVDGTQYTDRSSNVVTDVLPGLELQLKAATAGASVGITVGALS